MVFFAQKTNVEYPVGGSFNQNTGYIKACAESIKQTFPNRNIALICRGTSGTIIAGGVGLLLKDSGVNVTIVVSRKSSEDSHEYGRLTGMSTAISEKYALVVIDDFMMDGDTIRKILQDIDHKFSDCEEVRILDALCIANFIPPNCDIDRSWVDNLKRFNYIICNRKSVKGK